MQTVSCDLCGSSDSKMLYEKTDHWVKMGSWVIHDADNNVVHDTNVYCQNCGLIYINPRMTDEELAKFYEEDYRKTEKGTELSENISDQELYLGVYNALYAKQFVAKHLTCEEGAKALDIGCHTGSLLGQLRKLGFAPYGIEPDARSVIYPKKLYGLDNIFNGTIEAYDNRFGEFDLITICDCLEHVTSVTEVLQKLRSMLKPDGHLMIAIPAWQYPSVSVSAFLSSAHTYTFSPETITAYLHKTGFEPEVIDFSGHAKTMMVMARVAEPKSDFIPVEVADFWHVKCYLEKYQDAVNHFNYVEHLISDNKLNLHDQKVGGLFQMLMSYLSHDQWFPTYSSMRLSKLYRRLNNLDKELELLVSSLKAEGIEDNTCGKFDAYLRLAERALPDKSQAAIYLQQALDYGINYDDAVWPDVNDPLGGFLQTIPKYNHFHQLRSAVA